MPGRDSFLLNLVGISVTSFALGITLSPALGGGHEWTGSDTKVTLLVVALNVMFGAQAYVAWRGRKLFSVGWPDKRL